jgi:hypothetical protein
MRAAAVTRGYLALIAVTLCALAAVPFSVRVASVWWFGYSWHEMDWNDDGATTLAEVFRGIDMGKRTAYREGVRCVEYFDYKDGLPVRVDCPSTENRGIERHPYSHHKEVSRR